MFVPASMSGHFFCPELVHFQDKDLFFLELGRAGGSSRFFDAEVARFKIQDYFFGNLQNASVSV